MDEISKINKRRGKNMRKIKELTVNRKEYGRSE